VRLNAWLARAGVASRRGADELIRAGRVTVNGDPGRLNTFVGARDRVELDGRLLGLEKLAYVLLNKPAGVVTTARDPGGELSHRLAHPRYEVDKVYVAEVEGDPSRKSLAALEHGIDLDDGRTAPARVRRLGKGRVELVLHEGRKHQVKRMLAAVGHPVRRLHRSRYGPLDLEGLEPGDWRELTRAEVESLRDNG